MNPVPAYRVKPEIHHAVRCPPDEVIVAVGELGYTAQHLPAVAR